jgi:hypothetical protein
MPYLSREQVCVSPLRRMISPSLRRARRVAVAAAAVLLGTTGCEVPASSALPQGVDLPVVVQRAPRRAGDVLSRSQVLGTVRLGDDAAAAP